MEQLVFLLVVAVIGFINWLLNRSKEQGYSEGPKMPGPNPFAGKTAPQEETEEERIRRFMEALGVPELPRPKRPEPKAATIPKPEKPPQVVRPVQPRELPKEQSAPQTKVEQAYEATLPHAIAERSVEQPKAVPVVAELLRNRESVRSAVILREILGPPRGLQSWK